jgi:hypothetical protein
VAAGGVVDIHTVEVVCMVQCARRDGPNAAVIWWLQVGSLVLDRSGVRSCWEGHNFWRQSGAAPIGAVLVTDQTRRYLMGYIRIEVNGSFLDVVDGPAPKMVSETFSAQNHGHADATARAIQYLAEVVLPRATALDHDLHQEGVMPDQSFTPLRIRGPRRRIHKSHGLDG